MACRGGSIHIRIRTRAASIRAYIFVARQTIPAATRCKIFFFTWPQIKVIRYIIFAGCGRGACCVGTSVKSCCRSTIPADYPSYPYRIDPRVPKQQIRTRETFACRHPRPALHNGNRRRAFPVHLRLRYLRVGRHAREKAEERYGNERDDKHDCKKNQVFCGTLAAIISAIPHAYCGGRQNFYSYVRPPRNFARQ